MNLVPLIPCRQLCDQKPCFLVFFLKRLITWVNTTLFRCLFDFLNNREDDDAHEVKWQARRTSQIHVFNKGSTLARFSQLMIIKHKQRVDIIEHLISWKDWSHICKCHSLLSGFFLLPHSILKCYYEEKLKQIHSQLKWPPKSHFSFQIPILVRSWILSSQNLI